MRKTLAMLALAGALSLGLSGCFPQAPAPVETVTVQPEAPEAPETPAVPEVPEAPEGPPADAYRIFVLAIDDRFGPGVEDEAETIVQDFCTTMDQGGSSVEATERLLSATEGTGFTAEDLGYVLAAGIPAFCPHHQDAWDDMIAEIRRSA